MIRTIALLAVLTLGSAHTAEAANVAAAAVPVLAQSSSGQGQDSDSSRRSSRGTVRLIGLGVIVALGVGGWVIKKMRGQ